MKTANQLFLLSMLSALPAAAAAADSVTGAGQPAVDTSKWQCTLCKFENGPSGTLDIGVGNVSDKSFKFGDYTGLKDESGFLIGDGAVRFRGEDGVYWNANASNLGLDSRALDAERGKQGRYKLFLKYDQSPHYISDSAQTPFAGNGGASLSLPAGFPAAATGSMPLAGTLQRIDLAAERKRLGVGASWIPVRDWETTLQYRHEIREGTKRSAGAFFVNAAQLAEPVDYVTDQIDASASYTGGKWQAKIAYYGSRFRNGNDALIWQNPFTRVPPIPVIPGPEIGQLALPPDNQFHQVLASAGYQFSDQTRLTAEFALGRMTQNESFLPSTQNPTLAVAALPGSTLNGRAATLDANLKLTSALTQRLRLNAAYAYNDRENQTPQAAYPSVSTDMFVGAPRTNLPYSFKQHRLKLSADYRASAGLHGSVGVDFDSRSRAYQEADKSREDTIWGKISSRIHENVNMSLKLAHGERETSGYRAVAGIVPPENPLLRKYNMAGRARDKAALRADIAAADNVSVGLGIETSKDEYSDSTIGLTSGNSLNLNGDVSVMLTEDTSLHFFANREEIKAKQFGSQTFSTPDWWGKHKDTIDFIGIGVKHAAIKDVLDIGADYGVSRSWSEITVNTGAPSPDFPNFSTSLNSLKLYVTYRLKDNVSLRGDYRHERYDSRDWMLEGVAPNTIPNVLTFGEQAPRYRVNVISLVVRYKF